MIIRVMSGGQTGVDRAALDVALRLGVPCGGWCPRGRLAEDGALSPIYLLKDTNSSDYAVRTEWNVRDSDGTLILAHGPMTGGTAFTAGCARKHSKPCHITELSTAARVEPVWKWIEEKRIQRLNVAGPRESTSPGIYVMATAFLETLLTRYLGGVSS